MLRLGKHRGKLFEDVASLDRGYCAWVLRERALPLRSFSRYLINIHGGILTVGGFKWRFFDEMLEGAPGYCAWALTLEDPSESLQLFIDYLCVHYKEKSHCAKFRERTAAEEDTHDREPVRYLLRTDSQRCVRSLRSSCLLLGLRVRPMCRKEVGFVLRTYAA